MPHPSLLVGGKLEDFPQFMPYIGPMLRNSQASQLCSGEKPRMYTMQTTRAVEDPCVHAEIRRCIPTQASHQIAQQPPTLQARPTSSRHVTVASSDWPKLFGILPSMREKLEKTFANSHFYCKHYRVNTEWSMLKEKAFVSPSLWSRTSFL